MLTGINSSYSFLGGVSSMILRIAHHPHNTCRASSRGLSSAQLLSTQARYVQNSYPAGASDRITGVWYSGTYIHPWADELCIHVRVFLSSFKYTSVESVPCRSLTDP